MRAIYLDRRAGPEALKAGEISKPEPKAGEVLIRIHAAAITPTELQWFPTWNTPRGEPRGFPIVLGHEFSGVIEYIGGRVPGLKAGDAVYGLNDWFSNGAQAEYCVAAASAVARKPTVIDHVQASVVPISALTAWQGLFDKTHLQSGERILVHGAAGGVGVFVVQLARWRGAHIIATASHRNLNFVRSLGAHEVIDYRASRFEDAATQVDVVFDAVGGDTLERSWDLLGTNGRVVTVATQSESTTDKRAREAFMLVQANGSQLTEIAGLIDAGDLRVFVEDVYPLEKAREAYTRAQRGGMQGKIALCLAGQLRTKGNGTDTHESQNPIKRI